MMMTESPTPEPVHQRRIGERYPIRIPLKWAPVPMRQRRRRRPELTVQAFTHDLSLLGVGFESLTQRNIERGSPVTITIGRTRCRAAVRTIRPGHNRTHSVYGVEFRDPRMIDTVGDLIGGHGYNRRLSSDYPDAWNATRSENRHYFDRLTARSA